MREYDNVQLALDIGKLMQIVFLIASHIFGANLIHLLSLKFGAKSPNSDFEKDL